MSKISDFKTKTTQNISNQEDPRSIPPVVVGRAINQLADIVQDAILSGPTNDMGLAQPETDPGTPTTPERWQLKAGLTYDLFPNADGDPITVPLTSAGKAVIDATAYWDIDHWELIFDAVELPIGPQGTRGWSPVYSAVENVGKIAQCIVDYVGGTGIKPTEGIGKYVGPTGLVTNIADAVNYRADSTSINAELGVAPGPNILLARVFVAATYPLYSGLTVSSDDLYGKLVEFRKTGNIWSKFLTPISVSVAVDGFTSQGTTQAGSAKNDYLLNQQIEGGWTSETDYPTFTQGRLTTTSGTIGASIQKNVVSNANFGTMEIAVTPGEYYRVASVVQLASGTSPVLYLMENAAGLCAIDVSVKKLISTIANPEILLIPTGVVKLYINVYMTGGWSAPTTGVSIKKLTGVFKGTKERITALEVSEALLKTDADVLKTDLYSEEGDVLNGNFNLSDGRISTTTGLPDGDVNYKTTDALFVIPGNSYRYAFFNNGLGGNTGFDTIAYYDKNNALISRLLNNSTAPAGSVTARFTFQAAAASRFSAVYYGMMLNSVNNAVFLLVGDKFFAGLRRRLSPNVKMNLSNFMPEITRKSWFGKTLMVVGDSWTHQYSAIDGGNFVSTIQKRLGFAKAYRCCQGGQSFCQLPSIITFSATLPYLPLPSEAEIANVDCTVLFLGQNSRTPNAAVPGSGNAIGLLSDPASIDPATSTIYGQVKYHVEYYLTKNGKMRLYLASPGFSYESGGIYLPRLRQIVNVIKEVASYYSVGYIPIFEEAWGFYNHRSYLRIKNLPEIDDPLHPSYMGTDVNGTAGSDRLGEVCIHYMML